MAIISGPPTVSVSSGSFTGPAETLELVGDHCVAYSGVVVVDNSETTLLLFETGNYYVLLKWYPLFFESTTDNCAWKSYLNDSLVQQTEADSTTDNNETVPLRMVIPAYTQVKITAINAATSTNRNLGVSLTGRVYRG